MKEGPKCLEVFLAISLLSFASPSKLKRVSDTSLGIILHVLDAKVPGSESSNISDLMSAVVAVVEFHVNDADYYLMSWIAENPPANVNLGQMASSSFFRSLVQLVARQGSYFWFVLELMLFLVLGGCFARCSFLRGTSTDTMSNESEVLALVISAMLVTISSWSLRSGRSAFTVASNSRI